MQAIANISKESKQEVENSNYSDNNNNNLTSTDAKAYPKMNETGVAIREDISTMTYTQSTIPNVIYNDNNNQNAIKEVRRIEI